MHPKAKCPVCGTDLGDAIPDFCPTCGWECSTDITLFPSLTPLHGSDWDYYQRKLIQARERWTKTQDEIAKLAKAKADLEKKLKEARSISGMNKQKSAAFNRTTEQTRQKIKDIEFDKQPLVSTSPEMVFVEGGSFLMGFKHGFNQEKPVHPVTVSPFWIGKYEVTQAEWKKVMDTNPSYFNGDKLPVEQVSWYEAVEYCNKRSRLEGFSPCYRGYRDTVSCDWNANGYRLPTEAEWEFAARGGKLSRNYLYAGSNEFDDVGWAHSNSADKTYEVGVKRPNELGIHDMSGNVWEWCQDWYGGSYYNQSSRDNPGGPSSGSNRVNRGGSWSYNAASWSAAAAYRGGSFPDNRGDDLGFRLAPQVVGIVFPDGGVAPNHALHKIVLTVHL